MDSLTYKIDEDRVRLTKIDDRINCVHCGRLLALRNENAVLVRTRVVLIENDSILLRCGECGRFNTYLNGQLSLVI